MSEADPSTSRTWWKTPLLHRWGRLPQREDQVFVILALVIGAVTSLAVVAFILLTERMAIRLYPPGGAPWRRLLFPVVGSVSIGYILFRYFPEARGSGVPQTKAALLCTRRSHSVSHRPGKIPLYICNTGKRNSSWTRGAFRTGWCGYCFNARMSLRTGS